MRRRRDSSRRARPPGSFDERVAKARAEVLPEEPLAYVFTPAEGRGFFRIKAITESELGVKNQKGRGRKTAFFTKSRDAES